MTPADYPRPTPAHRKEQPTPPLHVLGFAAAVVAVGVVLYAGITHYSDLHRIANALEVIAECAAAESAERSR